MSLAFPDFCLLLLLHGDDAHERERVCHRMQELAPAGALTDDLEQAAARLAARELVLAPLAVSQDRLPWHQLAKRKHARRFALLFPGAEHERPKLEDEGLSGVQQLESQDLEGPLHFSWQPLPCDKRSLAGPFDIIGDLHGCCDELKELLQRLGYAPCTPPKHELWPRACWRHPEGRIAVFLGDLADRGPCILEGYGIVAGMLAAGHALCVPGNHDIKFRNYLQGRNMALKHGLEQSVKAMAALGHEVREHTAAALIRFIDSLPRHLVLDAGRLVAAHAGLEERLQLRDDDTARRMALWGPSTGEQDEFGLPVRINWAAGYQGQALVVYGHTPVQQPAWQGRTVNIDTGCVFGGQLTALRYPELEIVSVSSRSVYSIPPRPIRSVGEFAG